MTLVQDSARRSFVISGQSPPQPPLRKALRSQASRLALLSAVGLAALAGSSFLTPAEAMAACTITGAGISCDDTVTTDTTFPANVPDDRGYAGGLPTAINLEVVGGATVSGYGLATSNVLDGGIAIVNNGAITVDPGNTPTAGGSAALSLFANGGAITYSGPGTIINNGVGDALMVTQNGAGSIDLNLSGFASSATGTAINLSENVAGTGVSLTTTTVSGFNGFGIFVQSFGATGNAVVNANADVVGGNAGIYVGKGPAATGDITVTATGTVSGVGAGIVADNVGTGATTVTASQVIGLGTVGIGATTNGTGHLVIVADSVTGASAGVNARQINAAGTGNVSVTVREAEGDVGILATNAGTGSVTVITTGAVTGDVNGGIDALSAGAVNVSTAGTTTGATTGLRIRAGIGGGAGDTLVTGTGAFVGGTGAAIDINNEGTGTVTVNISGASSSAGGPGILFRDTAAGGTVDLTTGSVAAGAPGFSGIDARSQSLAGDLTVTANGAVVAADRGIFANLQNAGATGDLTVTANGAVTARAGVEAFNFGTGSVTVTTNGAVTTTTGIGIDARGAGAVTVTASEITAGSAGIYAEQYSAAGSGLVTVIANDDISGTTGIQAVNQGTGGVTMLVLGEVTATAADGISAQANEGALFILAGGPITAAADGIEATTVAGGSISISGSGLIDAEGYGIRARAAGGGDVVVVHTGGIGAVGDPAASGGILATLEGGAGEVQVIAGGDVYTSGANAYGVGIGAINFGTAGETTVAYQGTLTGPAIGLQAAILNAANASDVTVGVGTGSTITAGEIGVSATTVGAGDALAVLGDNVTIDPDDYGVIVSSAAGDATIVTGANAVIVVTNTDGDATAVGLYATSGRAADAAAGDEAVEIAIGANNSITIDDGAAGDADGAAGVYGLATGAAGSVQITALGGLDIDIVGNNAVGVAASTNAGDIGISLGTGTIDVTGLDAVGVLNFGRSAGINAEAVGGNINITSGVVITVDNNVLDATGIYAETTGAGDVFVTSNGAITSSGAGIQGGAVDGTLQLVNNAAILAETDGIVALSSGEGSVTVINTAGITADTGFGIVAFGDSATEAVVVSSSVGVINAGQGGIAAANFNPAAAATVQVYNSSSINAGLAGGGDAAIAAGTVGNGGVLVSNSGGTIGGSAGTGIVASSGGTTGNVTVLTSGTTSIGTAGNIIDGSGIVTVISNAASNGAILVDTDATGGIFTLNTGIAATNAGTGGTAVFNSSAIDAGGDGISVTSAGGTVQVGNFAAIVADFNGIETVNALTGTTTVVATANVTSNDAGFAGIDSTTTGTGTIGVQAANGVTVSGSDGIRTTSGGGVVFVTVGTGGVAAATTSVIGGTGAGDYAVDFANLAGGTNNLDIATNGVVRSSDLTTAGYGDNAVRAVGGSVAITNAGRIHGLVDLAGVTGTASLSNTGIWHTTGTSTFGAGVGTLTNSATGSVFTNAGGVATTFDFGAGADTFTNAGLLVVGEPALAASTLTITGLETWNNSGRIVFGSSGTNMSAVSDGQINDRILASGATFTGSGASRLVMDVNLGATPQTSCAVLAAADCLSLTGGSTAGSTQILVNDTGAAFGAFNPTGIVLVDVTGAGATAAGHFSLDPTSDFWRADLNSADGVLDKGLFFYDLTLDGKQHKLVGLPDGEAFEFTTFGAALSSIWQTTTGVWFERQADLRDQLDTGEGGPGVWVKITGSTADRDRVQGYELFGVDYSFDTSYSQDTVALIGGLDFVGGGSGKSWVVGGQIGYVDSDVTYDNSPTLTSFEGMTLGVYGSYVAGPLFVDGIINANMLDYDHQAITLAPAGSNVFSGSVDTLGFQVEAGWTVPLGANGFFEPLAVLSYSNSDVEGMSVPGSDIEFDDFTSLRASLGGRIGINADHGTFSTKWALVARYWNEFEGDNQVSFSSAPGFTLNDDFSGGFGEIGGTVNVFGADDRFSAFLNIGTKFQDDYQSVDGSLGIRWRW